MTTLPALLGSILDIVETKRIEVLANPNDPSWTEHFAEIQNEIKTLWREPMAETNKPDYIIVSGTNHIDLSDRVNKKIKEGYIPTGGLATDKGKDGTAYFFQAMVTSL